MRGFASRSSLALPVTNPYLVRDPPNFLTYDAEELEEFLTDETATAEEPHPDEADELSSICSGPSTLRGVHFAHRRTEELITDASQNTVLPFTLSKTPISACAQTKLQTNLVEKRSYDSLTPWTSRLRIRDESSLKLTLRSAPIPGKSVARLSPCCFRFVL